MLKTMPILNHFVKKQNKDAALINILLIKTTSIHIGITTRTRINAVLKKNSVMKNIKWTVHNTMNVVYTKM